jgi:hypothetical protein
MADLFPLASTAFTVMLYAVPGASSVTVNAGSDVDPASCPPEKTS